MVMESCYIKASKQKKSGHIDGYHGGHILLSQASSGVEDLRWFKAIHVHIIVDSTKLIIPIALTIYASLPRRLIFFAKDKKIVVKHSSPIGYLLYRIMMFCKFVYMFFARGLNLKVSLWVTNSIIGKLYKVGTELSRFKKPGSTKYQYFYSIRLYKGAISIYLGLLSDQYGTQVVARPTCHSTREETHSKFVTSKIQ